MFKPNTKFEANLLLYSVSHFEYDGHAVHMLTQQRLLPTLSSTVKLSLFMHVHSSPLSLAARLHWWCTNCSHYINNGWTFSWQTSYICIYTYICTYVYVHMHIYNKHFLSICLLTDTWVVSISWLLWIMLQWTWGYRYLFETVILFPSDLYTKVKLLDHMVVLFIYLFLRKPHTVLVQWLYQFIFFLLEILWIHAHITCK